jgi:hypothetical protein
LIERRSQMRHDVLLYRWPVAARAAP